MRHPLRIALIVAAGLAVTLLGSVLAAAPEAVPAPAVAGQGLLRSPEAAASAGAVRRGTIARDAAAATRVRGSRMPAMPAAALAGQAGGGPDRQEERAVAELSQRPQDRARRLPAPALDRPEASGDAVTTSVSGWDPAAPRELTLWRVEGGDVARLARTRSEPGGRFRFPEIAAGGREIVVTAGGDAPQAGDPRLLLPASPPAAPVAQWLPGGEEGARLRVWPSGSAVSVILAADGREIARRAVPASPVARDRALDLVFTALPDAALWIAEERAQGERSAWRRLDLEALAGVAGAHSTAIRR